MTATIQDGGELQPKCLKKSFKQWCNH